MAVVDDCGICLQPDSPDFNSCADCAGVIFGNTVVDSCGQCLLVFDANFNDRVDCAGTPNGSAILDFCGECLEASASQFNQSCLANNQVYFPNIFSPNTDGINDIFKVFARPLLVKEAKCFYVFDRWGSMIFGNKNFDFYDASQWWSGQFSDKIRQLRFVLIFAEIEFQTGNVELYKGDVMLMR